jgi:hypothetical protein
MTLFHGTDDTSRNLITIPVPNVDVTKGGGEFGCGFYLGDNMTLSIAWAKGKYKMPAVLQFDVNNKDYATLSFKQLNNRAAKNTWKQLRLLGTTHAHTFGVDVVFGPLITNTYAAQYKFESVRAQRILNDPLITPVTSII